MSEREREPRPHQQPRADGRAAAAARMAQQHTWVDLQVRQAIERGDFDDLPGAGKPIADLGGQHDPDWWIKKLVERENIAVLPPSIQLRKEDAELDDRLDKIVRESEVRDVIEDFNERVIAARYGNPVGPPLVTMPRDIDAAVAAWKDRRAARLEAMSTARPTAHTETPAPRRRWWRR